MPCEKQTSSKYLKRKSPPFPANQCPGEHKKGNDGNTWESVENKAGIYQWKPTQQAKDHHSEEMSTEIDLTQCKEFAILRNNSQLVGKQIATLCESGNLHLQMKSKFIPSLHETLEVNIFSVHAKTDFAKLKAGIWMKLQFTNLTNHYEIQITGHPQIHELMKICQSLSQARSNSDALAVTRDHHFGDLVLLTPYIVDFLKVGNTYYTVSGQGWETDYTGRRALGVLQFQGVQHDPHNTKTLELIGEETISTQGFRSGYFGTGSGYDPVHLVLRFRPGFRPPKSLPHATFPHIPQHVLSALQQTNK